MSQPTVSIGFSPTTPAAPSGFQNTVPQSDNATPFQTLSESVPNTGTAVVKTANYTAVAGDCGKLLVFNSSSAVTLTLPPATPFAQWEIFVQNVGAGVLTIARNGLLIDTAAANLTLNQASGIVLFTDGTNYFTERGAATPYVSPLTTKGDIFGHSTVDARIPVGSDGQSLVADSTQTLGVRWSDGVSTALLILEGNGATPTTGTKAFVQVPFAGTIIGWALIADQSGSASFDVWLHTSSAPPSAPGIPVSGGKISASAPVAISSAQSAAGDASAVSTWTTAVAQWSVLGFNLSSVTTCTRLTLEIYIKRS